MASPPPSNAVMSTPSSPCSPMTHGEDAASDPTSTNARQSPRSCATEQSDAARRSGSSPHEPNGQPAFGCYLPDAQAAIRRAYGLMVLTLQGDRISAITSFGDLGLFPHFGLPRSPASPVDSRTKEVEVLLDDKNAVIDGGGGATGGAVVRAFAREGARTAPTAAALAATPSADRRRLGRRGSADGRVGHGRRDRTRIARVLRRRLGADDDAIAPALPPERPDSNSGPTAWARASD
jgi:hypothetical protein